MHADRKLRPFLLALTLAALLLPAAGLFAAPARAASHARRALFSPEVTAQMRTLLEQKKLDLRHLPKAPFQLPVSRMVEEQLTRAGVKIAPHSLESICYENVYWNGGPTVASATNGTVTVWGSELGLYFAKASDPAHPATFSFGDIPLKIHIRGSQVFVHGLWYSYLFDVSNPSDPKFVTVVEAGAWQGYRSFAWTPDGSKIVAVNEDWLFGGWGGCAVIEFDASTFSPIGWAFPGGFFGGVALSDVVVPENPGNVAVVSGGVIQDPNSWFPVPPTLYLVDLNPTDCQGDLSVIGTIDCSATGNAGSMLAVGNTLYVNRRPFWSYNSILDGWFYAGFGTPLPGPDQAMTVDVYNVSDFADPTSAALTGTFTREGDDPVAWYAAAAGRIVVGSYQDHVLQMPAGLGDPISTVTLGDYAGSGGARAMQDLGWDAASGKGVGACQSRGARFFTSLTGPESGHYWTGGASQNPALAGSYLLVPQGTAGLAVLDVTDGVNPRQAGALEGEAVTLVAVSADGNTAYATDGTAKVWVVSVADKAHPASVAGTTYSPGAAVTALACKGTTVYVGTAAGVEVVDYATATSPVLLKALPATGSAGVRALKVFRHPAYPLNTFLVTAEGDRVQLLDVTGPTNPAGYEYYVVASIAMAPYGDNITIGTVACNYIATDGSYLYVLDAAPVDYWNGLYPTSYLRPVYAKPLAGHFPDVIGLSTDGTTPFSTGDNTPYNPSYEGWVGLETVQSGILVTGMEGASAIGTVDVGTDPNAPAWAPPTTWAFPRFVTNNGYALLDGFAVGNGWIWAAGGPYGVMGVSVQPGWQDMEITSVDASPKYSYPGAASGSFLLKGMTTFSATIKTGDAPCRMVKLGWGPVTETWVGEIPANTVRTLSWSEDLDTIWGEASQAACGSGSGIVATAETTDMSNCSIYATKWGEEYYRTNVPPTSYSIWNVDPPAPSADPCTGVGGAWAVCSPITFNIFWNDCYGNIDASGQPASGITQVALYVDAKLVSVLTNPPSEYPGPQLTIDPVALGLADGGHSFFSLATNAVGKRAQTVDFPFSVHMGGPVASVTAPSGDVATGAALRVAARVTSPAGLPVRWARFYLDVDPSDPALVAGAGILPATGTDLGTATASDSLGQFSVTWDSTSTPEGTHTLIAFATDSVEADACQYLTFSPTASFTLAPYVAPTVSVAVDPAAGTRPLPVTFTATPEDGVGPFTYAWDLGDSSTATTNPVTHIYASAGAYTWRLTATDSRGTAATATGTVTVNNPVAPPFIAAVTKASGPFRLIITGANLQSGCRVKIDGADAAGTMVYRDATQVVAKGNALKEQLPKGTAVGVTVVNPDGGVSNAVSFAR